MNGAPYAKCLPDISLAQAQAVTGLVAKRRVRCIVAKDRGRSGGGGGGDSRWFARVAHHPTELPHRRVHVRVAVGARPLPKDTALAWIEAAVAIRGLLRRGRDS